MEFLVRDLRIDVIMLFMVIYLIAKTYRRRNESLKHQYFHRLLWVGLMQVILVTAILFGDTIQQMPVIVDFIILLAYFFGLCLCTYGWFMYSEITRESKLTNNKRFRLLLIVPLVIYFLLCVTSWWTKLLMYVDEDGLYQRGDWAFLQFLIPSIYAVVLVFRSLERWRETKKFDAFQRGVLFFPISHAIAIVLQIMYGGDYIVIATVSSLVVAYIELYSIEEYELDAAVQRSVSMQREKNIIDTLYTDSLTGLRNRRYFFEEIQHVLDQKQQKICYSVNMHDFKRINLLYGHKKGDSLLLAISGCLRKAFPELEICRLSGDEFGFMYSPKEFNQYEMSVLAHSLFNALHTIKVEGLEKERFNFYIGAVFITPAGFQTPDDVLTEGVITMKMAREHPGNFIWSEQGSFPDVEGCFIELSEDRILYNSLNNRLFSIQDEQDWFNYLHDGAVLKENMFRHNVANIDDILSYFKNKGLPDFEYERLFHLVTQYAVHIDAFMFEMLVNDILIPYFESQETTDRNRSYLGHLYMLMADCLISVLRMGDLNQLKRIRVFLQKARDITRDFPHDSIRFEPYFYTLCETVGHYESLQGVLCDKNYIDEAYEELRELLTGEDRFIVPNQNVYKYFSVLVDNARLFPIFRACFLLLNKHSLKPAEQEEYQQRLDYIRQHLSEDGVYDLTGDHPELRKFVGLLQTILFDNLSANELLERLMKALHDLRLSGYANVTDANIVSIAYLFLGASQALAYCDKTDEEKRQIGIEGMEFLIEILRNRQAYATDGQVIFLIQVLMKSMFNTPVLSPALKYHYIKQAISASMLDTYCHSKAVSSYAKLILSNIVDEHPELLVGSDRPYQTIEDVKANRENLLEFMECACMLHDIGKLYITSITSNAYRRLTDQEFGFIRRHPAFGISYLKEDEAFEKFYPFAYEHHRWWNGEAGYPKVEANDTPTKLKILVDLLSICDSLEAATSRIGRNYRTAKNFLQLLDEFIVDSGTRYSADVVNFIIGSQKTFYQLRLMVDKNWQKEYLSIFQEVVTGSDYRAICDSSLPDLYAHNVNVQNVPAAEGQSRSFDVPEWYKSMDQESQTIFAATLFEYSRLMSLHDKSVTFFYNVDSDRVGFLHPTPEGKVDTIFINHFSEKRINLVLSEEGYHKAIGIIHRIIDEPDFPKTGETKLEYSDKSRCLIATYTSIMSQDGQVLSIAGRLQDIQRSTDRLLQTINNQNKFIEIFDSFRNILVTAIYSDVSFDHFEILKGFPMLDEAAKNLNTTIELKNYVCANVVDEEYREAFVQFLDHTTLQQRLYGKTNLTLEYHSKLSGWLLARLIPVKYDDDGNITSLIFACESTEAEHQQRALLQYAATYDSMTGLLNRSTGESMISKEIAKGGEQIFVILDCDHFKQINDQSSHLVGDKVLSGQGGILKEFFSNDICMRLGGDEFVAYINGEAASRLINSFDGLQKHFETLKENLASLRLEELDNIPPTMCMGIVYTRGTAEKQDFESLYQMADDALKQSKKLRFGAITITELTDRQH